ncbi:class I SAM-dependent methyltransferase [Pseudenhygromyxa sp. WMMC2535]|uniref:class I SAM-dependent methyltransferase n=1 Tax=Pseudenhygromyxa sp. WMMC2535 TaxID=2712867 RepID=UPI001554A5FB|nr:class I SAM-dependent methyltransferase [Pseudenhygromyxa sp. WMMC2535]NVB37447.1 class I SAM-dependent methyltransferase [Pseudenhygromyxa sp. WMMC2535]
MQPTLTDVPETMLWTLHNRATEAKRPDGVLRDPDAVRIYDAIDYDYERSFGAAEPSHALRSILFDEHVRRFLAEHPGGVIVNLGEGLETQRFRVTVPDALWFSVDVPDAAAWPRPAGRERQRGTTRGSETSSSCDRRRVRRTRLCCGSRCVRRRLECRSHGRRSADVARLGHQGPRPQGLASTRSSAMLTWL